MSSGGKTMIPVFSNTLGDEELAAVQRVFESRWLGQGRECDAFESEFSADLGGAAVLLTNCATSGIYIALQAHGIGPGCEVIVPTVNFVAVANAVVDLGATPVFADVDPIGLNLLPSEVERLRTPRTRAIFLLHYGGHPAPFDDIQAAAGPGVAILEDSANAVRTVYRGRRCGTLGDAGVFSFDAMKILVMGDGGALVVRDPQVLQRCRSLRYLGLAPRTTSGMDARREGHSRWWEFDLSCTSGRFISNDVLAAVGRVQLQKLPGFIDRRRQVWEQYQRGLAGAGSLTLPPEPPGGCTGSYYLYWIRVPGRRDELAAHLAECGVYTTFRYYPLHLVSHYGQRCRLPIAEQAAEEMLNLPLHQNLSDDQVAHIIDAVRRFFA